MAKQEYKKLMFKSKKEAKTGLNIVPTKISLIVLINIISGKIFSTKLMKFHV